jgi:hypothetical protein
LIEAEAAVLFRDVDADHAQFRRLANQFARQLPVLPLQLIGGRTHFIVHKLARRLGDHPVLFREIFRREHFLRRALFDQKTTAHDDLFLFGYG